MNGTGELNLKTNKSIPHISGYGQLKKLRTALAISQGTKLLSVLHQEADRTVSHDQTKRVTYLTGLFSRIHREMFHHWKDQASVSHRPGTMPDSDKRKIFREALECLVLDGDENKETAIFDNNGFVIKIENVAERLSLFYQDMRCIRPFAYGNRITLDFFMTALGALPAFKAVYEPGIDFRRLDEKDAMALHNPLSSLEEISLAFEHALDPTRNKSLDNKPNSYGRWPENRKFISGIPFLSHITEQGVECLVTVTGGLIPVTHVNHDLFTEGKHLADYPRFAPEKCIGYLPGMEDLRKPEKKEIDGTPIGARGEAPLFCLDTNMLTGLRPPSHTELVELLRECVGQDATPFDLANNETLKIQLLALAENDERLMRSIEIAYSRLGLITQKLATAIQGIFAGKTPATNPHLFMPMGGAGSGKTAVEEIATAHCGENFVIASLDEFRKQSDLYQVLTAANHHSDDYVYVEPFANRLRDMVADHARKASINILYDGTGIPYKPRYLGIVEQFKLSGFKTQVVAVDAFIIKPKGREDELLRTDVISSVKERFKQTGRALPWVITVFKHLRAPRSFLHALEHQSLDKISLFANDGEPGQHYLVAESFSFFDLEVRTLHKHQKSGTLSDFMRLLIRNRDNSILKNIAHNDIDKIEALINKNPDCSENNVAYQIYHSKNGYRVLAIYNIRRMVDFVEKRQLNPNASGPEGLLHKTEVLAFHVDPLAKRPWITRLQGSRSD